MQNRGLLTAPIPMAFWQGVGIYHRQVQRFCLPVIHVFVCKWLMFLLCILRSRMYTFTYFVLIHVCMRSRILRSRIRTCAHGFASIGVGDVHICISICYACMCYVEHTWTTALQVRSINVWPFASGDAHMQAPTGISVAFKASRFCNFATLLGRADVLCRAPQTGTAFHRLGEIAGHTPGGFQFKVRLQLNAPHVFAPVSSAA